MGTADWDGKGDAPGLRVPRPAVSSRGATGALERGRPTAHRPDAGLSAPPSALPEGLFPQLALWPSRQGTGVSEGTATARWVLEGTRAQTRRAHPFTLPLCQTRVQDKRGRSGGGGGSQGVLSLKCMCNLEAPDLDPGRTPWERTPSKGAWCLCNKASRGCVRAGVVCVSGGAAQRDTGLCLLRPSAQEATRLEKGLGEVVAASGLVEGSCSGTCAWDGEFSNSVF